MYDLVYVPTALPSPGLSNLVFATLKAASAVGELGAPLVCPRCSRPLAAISLYRGSYV
jgi:hypothetical protein